MKNIKPTISIIITTVNQKLTLFSYSFIFSFTILFYLLEQKLQLKYDFEKELEELYRKYDIKRKEVEVEFQNIRKNLDTQHNIVLVNKILAEAFRAKSMDLKVSGASRMQQGIFLQL